MKFNIIFFKKNSRMNNKNFTKRGLQGDSHLFLYEVSILLLLLLKKIGNARPEEGD